MATPRGMEVLSTESTLTRRGQTTIPSEIRKALRLRPSDKIRFSLRADNTVVISRGDEEFAERDPMVSAFLAFIDEDARANPQRVQPVPQGLVTRAQGLTKGVDVDLDAPLDPERE